MRIKKFDLGGCMAAMDLRIEHAPVHENGPMDHAVAPDQWADSQSHTGAPETMGLIAR